MTNWIVAHCHSNAEFKAESHLTRQGYCVYVPKYKKARRHARRVETVIRPLFPRYIFIAYNPTHTHWRPISSTVGVTNLITAGERPLRVPSWVIEQLQESEDGGGFYVGTNQEVLKKGDAIEFTNGPFLDHQGVFYGLNDSQRVAVLLDIMGRQVKTLVPLEEIRRAS